MHEDPLLHQPIRRHRSISRLIRYRRIPGRPLRIQPIRYQKLRHTHILHAQWMAEEMRD